MNPYSPIRKVPLDYQGIQSNAFSVQMEREDKEGIRKFKEVGTVSNNYLLVPNTEVRDMAVQIADQSGVNFTEDKTFFDGKRYITSYIAKDDTIGEVGVGDDVAIGFQMWNSYDGSTSLGFRMMIYRLACLNGMMSHTNLSRYRFRHDPLSENWDKELENVTHTLKSASRGDNNNVHDMISNFKKLQSTEIDIEKLFDIRFDHLQSIPTQVWGSLMDRFLRKSAQLYGGNGWDLLNSATDELWHKEKPTVASYNHNATIVDGLCNWVQA